MESSREPMQEADALPISVISYLSSALGTFLRSQAPASTPAVTSSTESPLLLASVSSFLSGVPAS